SRILNLLWNWLNDMFLDVRLVKGGSRCAGTVEVNREGQWGTVVNFYWDINDAEVVCRELDCGSAISAPRRAHFGEGSGQELLTEVACNGTESTLSMCQSENTNQIRALGFIPAPHIYDAGVICSGSKAMSTLNVKCRDVMGISSYLISATIFNLKSWVRGSSSAWGALRQTGVLSWVCPFSLRLYALVCWVGLGSPRPRMGQVVLKVCVYLSE
uniref:SRCR domain-containing protein n=1 Tax=Scleropages formosus TaxID=113540 RepID=A0A8C9TF24_SCLFO